MPIAVHGMNPVVDAATGKIWIIGGGTNGGYGMSSIVQAFDLAVYTANCDGRLPAIDVTAPPSMELMATAAPSSDPTAAPSSDPTAAPSSDPTAALATAVPTQHMTQHPSPQPTVLPVIAGETRAPSPSPTSAGGLTGLPAGFQSRVMMHEASGPDPNLHPLLIVFLPDNRALFIHIGGKIYIGDPSRPGFPTKLYMELPLCCEFVDISNPSATQ